MNNNPLIISLVSGPGCGKSTLAAKVFYELKCKSLECELVTEYAKDLTYQESFKVLRNQIYILGKQHQRIYRLLDKVDFIITDSPFILGLAYLLEENEPLKNLIVSEYKKLNNINFFIKRETVYNPNGRNQTLEQSIILDNEIKNIFIDNDIPFYEISKGEEGYLEICSKLVELGHLNF